MNHNNHNNQNSHKNAPNENYGRELLELFSMGIDESGEGAYTEDDVKEAARAFTGWASRPTPPPFFLGPFPMEFRFDPDDHDRGEKTFLGETGNWNGEDIINIIVRNRVTAEFICKRLYLFFVSDGENQHEIKRLADTFQSTNGDIRSVLRDIFLSDHFRSREIRFKKTKSPAELVFGATRLTDRFDIPDMDSSELASQTTFMGQFLLNPPSVEGWHNGTEWINSGTLMKRTNFVSRLISDTGRLGVRRIIDRIKLAGTNPKDVVDACLDIMGPMEVSDQTLSELVAHSEKQGNFNWNTTGEERLIELLQLLVATREFQFA